MIEVGRVCMKTAGREMGRYCVVLKKVSDSFVMVTGPRLLTGVKRRKCNIEHLQPTSYMLEVKDEAPDEDVLASFDKAGLITKLELKRPSAADMKSEKAKEKPKVEEKKEQKEKKSEKKPKEK